MTHVLMIGHPCDRCGRDSPALHPFKLSEVITFRKKEIRFPWLCLRCMKIEKRKWWAAR